MQKKLVADSRLLQRPTSVRYSPSRSTCTISAIIPARNEGGRIGAVLSVLHKVGVFCEIIVVDDGSTDSTFHEADLAKRRDPRIKILQHSVNLGKGQAMRTGWQSTQSRYLLFLDADLVGLTPEHVLRLVNPVLQGKADMTIGIFKGGKFNTDLAHLATPWLSGQRCLRAELLQAISFDAASGYGIETAITVAARLGKWRGQKVTLRGVTHPTSEHRHGFISGTFARAEMYRQILRAWWYAGGLNSLIPEKLRENIVSSRSHHRVKGRQLDR